MALKRFLEKEPNGMPTTMNDLKGLKESCTPEEFEALGKQACKNLGEEWTAK
jgi:hypothetical protein